MKLSDKDYIGKQGICAFCGSEVAGYTANEELCKVRPDACDWDWWYSCENTDCPNHEGEGVFQKKPRWCLR